MTNSRVFWLVHGIKQRVGHGSTSRLFLGIWKVQMDMFGLSSITVPECRAGQPAAGSVCNPSAWGFPHFGGLSGEQQLWDLSRVLGREACVGYYSEVL